MKSKMLHLVEVFIVIFTFSSCESKFYESSPTTVRSDGRSLDDRLAQKTEIDLNIAEIQRGISKVKSAFDFILGRVCTDFFIRECQKKQALVTRACRL